MTDESFENQSQFNTGLEVSKDIQESIRRANIASHLMTMEGIREWWLNLQDIDRSVTPRLRIAQHKKQLEEVRVDNIPMNYVGKQSYAAVLHYRRKLTAYQNQLEFIRDKLGLGFKPGEDPRGAILR